MAYNVKTLKHPISNSNAVLIHLDWASTLACSRGETLKPRRLSDLDDAALCWGHNPKADIRVLPLCCIKLILLEQINITADLVIHQ
jgi:hypothetical protein